MIRKAGVAGGASGSLCYLASGPIPSRQANAVNVLGMCRAMEKHGFDVEIVSPVEAWPGTGRESPGETDMPRIHPVYYPSIRGGTWWYRRRVAGFLNAHNPDFVYGRNLWGCGEAARLGLRVAYEAHLPVWRRNEKKRQAFESMISERSFAGLVAVSDALLRDVVRAYPQLDGKAFTAHDAASYRDGTSLRRGGADGHWEVMYTGSLYPGKGMELIMELAPRCPWARFRVIGGEEREVLKWKEASAGRIGNLDFTGYVPHREVPDYLEMADILIAPYLDNVKVHGGENDASEWMSPLKIFEYMRTGRPIVCSDLPVLREVLVHGVNALLAPPSRVDLWVRALESLRDDRSLATTLANRARKDFEKFHTWDARAARVVDLLGWRKTPDRSEARGRTRTSRTA